MKREIDDEIVFYFDSDEFDDVQNGGYNEDLYKMKFLKYKYKQYQFIINKLNQMYEKLIY